jgi:hypothetical protein
VGDPAIVYVTVEQIELRKRAAIEALVKLVECGGDLIAQVEIYAVEAQRMCRDLEAAGAGLT